MAYVELYSVDAYLIDENDDALPELGQEAYEADCSVCQCRCIGLAGESNGKYTRKVTPLEENFYYSGYCDHFYYQDSVVIKGHGAFFYFGGNVDNLEDPALI